MVDPGTGLNQPADVLIEGGHIAAVGQTGSAPRIIEAAGLLVTPGLIDVHVHLRQPGGEAKETIASGTAAAVAGGFTTVACMPNTSPPLDTPERVREVIRIAEAEGHCRVLPIACLSHGREGRQLVDFAALAAAGAMAFSDDGDGLASDALMDQAFRELAALGRVAIQHCETPDFPRGVLHDGPVARDLGLPGLHPLSEILMIARDLVLSELHRARYHVAHVSTAHGVELVRRAKQGGVPVTAEVCPHHLLLTDEACRGLDPNTKMHPPLRPAEDVAACIAGLLDGTIDLVATDHAPHTPAEKAAGFAAAPAGIIGLETALPLAVRALVEPGRLDWYRLIELLSTAPARAFQLPGGALRPGAPADVTIIDPAARWTIDPARFRSRSRNCPFAGWEVQAQVVCTIVAGQVRYQRPHS